MVTDSRTAIVLAAGEGKRMKSAVPKMLHPLLGRTLLGHVIMAIEPLQADRVVAVVGTGAEQMAAHLGEIAPKVTTVLQENQRGTGNAVRVAVEAIGIQAGTVVIVNGDVPLLYPRTLGALVEAHEAARAAATVLTAEVPDPYGLGRIIRDPETDAVDAIVEERDATPEQRLVTEINAGLYAFDAALLGQTLGKLTSHNDQGEEYLTDVIGLLVESGRTVQAYATGDPTEVLGCNDRVELAGLRAILRDRINQEWMRTGVTIIDPATTWIDVTVRLGQDCVVEPNTHLRGLTEIGPRASIGPDTTLVDTSVGEEASVVRAHAVGVVIGARASVGPYAYLRPGAVLRERSRIGTFVEVKNSDVGAGSKIPHLSYVGDATIGEETNIGAATVFVNYDGQAKHHSVIGSHARTGADNMFVAPVEVGDGAYTAAGSVITKNVPPGALGVGRSDQRNVDGWVQRRRPGTKAAEAAEAALAGEPAASEQRVTNPSPSAARAGRGSGSASAATRARTAERTTAERTTAKRTTAKRTTAAKSAPAAKRTAAKRTTAEATPTRAAATKSAATKNAATKNAATKSAAAKNVAAKNAAAKNAATRRPTARSRTTGSATATTTTRAATNNTRAAAAKGGFASKTNAATGRRSASAAKRDTGTR